MSIKRRNGRLTLVSGGQSLGEGRASRAEGSSVPHRPPLPGEEGAIASLVLAFADPQLASTDPVERKRAAYAVGHARKRVRAAVGRDSAPEVFARAQVTRRDLAAVQAAHEAARERLVAGAVDAVRAMQEHEVGCTSARTSVAVALRLYALGSTLLDVGARDLDLDKLKAGSALIASGRLEFLNALELDRRAKLSRGSAASLVQQQDAEQRLAAYMRTEPAPAPNPDDAPAGAPAGDEGTCTECGLGWPRDLSMCPHCGEPAEPAEEVDP